jgi:hypothetical protein
MKFIIIAIIAVSAFTALGGQTTPVNSTTATPSISAQAVTEKKETPPTPSEAKEEIQTKSNTLPDISQVLPKAKAKGKTFWDKASSACFPALVETEDESNSIAECKKLNGQIFTVIVK